MRCCVCRSSFNPTWIFDNRWEQQGKELTMAEQTQPAMLKINDVDYKVKDLSDDAKEQVQGIQVAEAEMKRLNIQLALAQTARNAYMQALQAALSEQKKGVMLRAACN